MIVGVPRETFPGERGAYSGCGPSVIPNLANGRGTGSSY